MDSNEDDNIIGRRFAQQVHCTNLKDQLRGHSYTDQDQFELLTILNNNCTNKKYKQQILKLFIQLVEDGKNEINEDVTEQYVELLMASAATQEQNVVSYKFDDNVKVSLYEEPSIIAQHGSTGNRTWEAAMALSDYLYKNQSDISGSDISQFVELGAGTGLVGITAFYLFGNRRVILTDGDDKVVSDLKNNIKLNTATTDSISAQKLRWGVDEPLGADGGNQAILCADVTYDPDIIPDLVQCIFEFLSKISNTKYVLLSATLRSQQTFDTFREECKNKNISLNYECRYTAATDTENQDNCLLFIPPHSPPVEIYKLTLA